MEPTEEKLKRAMSRVDAPDGFAERVMVRVAAQSRASQRPSGKPHLLWLESLWNWIARPVPAAAMAAVILVALGLGVGYWPRQAASTISERERIEGQKASAQLMLALEITGAHLSRMHALLAQQPPIGPTPGDQ